MRFLGIREQTLNALNENNKNKMLSNSCLKIKQSSSYTMKMNYQMFYYIIYQEMFCGVNWKFILRELKSLTVTTPSFFGLQLFLLFLSIFYELLIDVCSPLHISHNFNHHTLEQIIIISRYSKYTYITENTFQSFPYS